MSQESGAGNGRRHVVVCGAGMAGLTAAVTALQAGAAVTLVDKAPEVGGTAALSGGLVWTMRDEEALHRYVPNGNPALQGLVLHTLADGRRWLETLGAVFDAEEDAFGYGWGQRMDPAHGLGCLLDAFHRLGGTLGLNTALDSLRVERAAVTGLNVVRDDGSSETIAADAVVLATGGFQGNAELLGRYIAPANNLYLRASGWSTGDGLLAASAIGAAATPGLDTFYGHALCGPPSTFRPIDFRDASQIYGAKSVALNLEGRRFCDESVGTGEEDLNQALGRQTEGRGFYIVDAATADAESRPKRRITKVIIDWAARRGTPVVIADTIPELCERLAAHGLPPDVARDTIETYNAACASGTTARLSPPRVGEPIPLLHPPFFAVSVKAAITFTMGGIAVDERARVLRRSQTTSPIAQSVADVRDVRESPIAGLYAAGCDVGNVSNRGYVGGLATALTTGRVAGREAARG